MFSHMFSHVAHIHKIQPKILPAGKHKHVPQKHLAQATKFFYTDIVCLKLDSIILILAFKLLLNRLNLVWGELSTNNPAFGWSTIVTLKSNHSFKNVEYSEQHKYSKSKLISNNKLSKYVLVKYVNGLRSRN